MKKILLGFVIIGLAITGYSQQLFQTTQFMVNPYTLNPALAGSEDFLDIKAGYRSQWTGLVESDNKLDGPINPRTTYLSAHTALGNSHEYYRDPRHERQNFHGVGGFVMKDELGAFSSISGYGSYSYNMLLVKAKNTGQMYGFNGRTKKIGLRMVLGAHLGFIQQRLDFNKFVDTPGGEPGVLTDQGLINGENRESAFAPDASIGAWFYTNYFFGGVAMRRILGNNVGLPTKEEFTLQRHYNLMVGYKFFLSNLLLLEPSAVMKIESDVRLSAYDLNLRIAYDNTYSNRKGIGNQKKNDINVYAGTTFRPGSALAFMVGGVFMRRYEVAYSFDLTSNQLGPYENGTHEVTVGYRIEPKKVFRTAETHHNHFK